MGDALLIWVMGWALVVGSMDFTLRQAAKDHEERSASAWFRTTWSSSHQGRAAMCISLLFTWPVMIPLILHAAWVWFID